ncbi:hypothetical protein CS8_053540 [Cupriavidus sp. 8B]
MVAPEATNSPVPIEPPMAIMVRWRARKVRRKAGGGGWEAGCWLVMDKRNWSAEAVCAGVARID